MSCWPNWSRNWPCSLPPRPSQLDTTLLIHPLAMTDFLDYHFFLAEAEALIRNNGYDGIFQIAGLHPQYEFAGSDPDDVANYTNRAPYPMLHLLRESSIDRAVAAFPDAAEIFERNIETMEKSATQAGRNSGSADAPSAARRQPEDKPGGACGIIPPFAS